MVRTCKSNNRKFPQSALLRGAQPWLDRGDGLHDTENVKAVCFGVIAFGMLASKNPHSLAACLSRLGGGRL